MRDDAHKAQIQTIHDTRSRGERIVSSCQPTDGTVPRDARADDCGVTRRRSTT